MRILILGGYGVFGGRLAELLSDIAETRIIIAGRSSDRAQKFCRAYRGETSVEPLQLDRTELGERIGGVAPDLVVDASGPFQNYGDNRYTAVEACIGAGVPYLDLADGSDFAVGISQFDEAAKKAGVFVLSGVSSFPVLTAAVVRELSHDMEPVSVTGGIAPSPYAGIGLNVMRAVIGYAGGPVRLMRDGRWGEAKGLTESKRFTVAPSGMLPLRNIHFSLVDVPDLQVIPKQYDTLQDIWMGAGPLPEVLHRMLNLLAKLRAALKLSSFGAFAPLFYRILNLMKSGEHRGGMIIHVKGFEGGKPVERSWHLLAEGDDGSYIPSMAVEAIIRKMLTGEKPAPGARPATETLTLADYDKLFEKRTIYTGFREKRDADDSLYKRILGSAFRDLPLPLQELHGETGQHQWSGRADVIRGTNPLAKLVGALIGFPEAGKEVPVTVTFKPEAGGERWTRIFGGKTFSSQQTEGQGRDKYLLLERFGTITIAVALLVKEERLYLIPRHWRFLGIPLPKILMPSGKTFESEDNGDFCFDVEIKAPLIGLIVAYHGRLQPADQKAEATEAPSATS